MAAFDFKKAYKDLYQPGTSPSLVTVPPLRFLAVRGAGDPAKLKTVIRHPIRRA